MPIEKKTLCVAGYHPKSMCGRNPANYEKLVRHLTNVMEEYGKSGYGRVVSMGNQGFDQLVFWAVENARKRGADIRNELMLPEKDISARWPKTGLFGQRDFALMLKRAARIHRTWTDGSLAYAMRNVEEMVKMSDKVLVMKKPGTGHGCTAHCMEYAISQNKPIDVINCEVRGFEIVPSEK